MKLTHLFIAGAMALCGSQSMQAQSLGDLLKGLGQGGKETADSTSPAPASQGDKASGLGQILSSVAGALGLGSNDASIDKLSGVWKYAAPAVAFKSDNFLLKAGGAAAAAQLEKQLEPYYTRAGLTGLELTINTDSTFTFKVKRASLPGTIEYNAQGGNYVFKFKALGKVTLTSMDAYIQLTGSKMELTFDVSKLMTLVDRVSAVTGNSTLKGASAMLQQYDGMTAGFELNRTGDAPAKTESASKSKWKK